MELVRHNSTGAAPSWFPNSTTPFQAELRPNQSWPYVSSDPVRSHDALADGSFLAVAAAGDSASRPYCTRYRVSEMQVVLNFAEELKARVNWGRSQFRFGNDMG